MTTNRVSTRILPNLMIAAGIILATYLDKHPPFPSQGSLVSAITMVSAILGADVLDSLLRYGVATFSWAMTVMGSGFLLAAWLFRSAGAMGLLIPSLGAVAWVVLLGKSKTSQKLCKPQPIR
jgi:hypothetical protein